jgi:hypothetical protein
MTPFKPGDWIIASQPKFIKMETRSGQIYDSEDRSFLDLPIRVVEITEAHLVIEKQYSWQRQPQRDIMPMCELEERGFIIASPILVETALFWR